MSINERSDKEYTPEQFNLGYKSGYAAAELEFKPKLENAWEIIECYERAQAERAKETQQPDDCIEAIKAGIAEARKLFSENPDQFNGELSDDDLVAFIHMALHRCAPERESVSRDDIKDVIDLAAIKTPAGVGYDRRCAENAAAELLNYFKITRIEDQEPHGK